MIQAMIQAWRQAIEPLGTLAQAKLVLPALLLVAFWCWETWQPFFQQRKDRLRHGFRNLVIALLNTTFLAFTLGILTAIVAHWTETRQLGLLNLVALPFGAGLIGAVLLLDCWMYVWHRANHRIPFLWRFHRMHHSDKQMDVTTATRFHLGEHIGGATLRLGLIPLLGLSVWQIVIYEMLVLAITQFHHANISLGRYDRLLQWLIVTPNMHKVHHSRWQRETDSNYSTLFSFWDRFGRSFRMRRDLSTIEYGLDEFDAPSWQTVTGMLKTPLAPGSREQPGASDAIPSDARLDGSGDEPELVEVANLLVLPTNRRLTPPARR